MLRKLISLSGLLLFLIATTGMAKADTLYYFTNSGYGVSAPASTLCGGTNCFGVVDLQQVGNNVDVTVTMTPGVHLISTGNANSHETFAFDGSFSSSSSITSPTGWSLGKNGTEAGIGTFDFYQECDIDDCTKPGKSTLSSLSFTVDDATIADFGTSFAADVWYVKTGNIDTVPGPSTPPTPPTPPVPEPSSLLLLGTGLAALAGTLKLKLFSGV